MTDSGQIGGPNAHLRNCDDFECTGCASPDQIPKPDDQVTFFIHHTTKSSTQKPNLEPAGLDVEDALTAGTIKEPLSMAPANRILENLYRPALEDQLEHSARIWSMFPPPVKVSFNWRNPIHWIARTSTTYYKWHERVRMAWACLRGNDPYEDWWD